MSVASNWNDLIDSERACFCHRKAWNEKWMFLDHLVRNQKDFPYAWARSWPTPKASFFLLSADTSMLFVLERGRCRRKEKRKPICSYVNSARQQHNTWTSQKYPRGFQAYVERVIWHFSALKLKLDWNRFLKFLYLSPDVQWHLISNFMFATWLYWF